MSEKNITFEDLPKAMSWMMDKLNELDSKIDGLNNPTHNIPTEQWMNLKELCEYIPSIRPNKQYMDGRVAIKFHFIKEGNVSCFLNQK